MEKMKVMISLNTEELIRRLKREDKSAVDELFQYYYIGRPMLKINAIETKIK